MRKFFSQFYFSKISPNFQSTYSEHLWVPVVIQRTCACSKSSHKQQNMWNLFKVNNKGTREMSLTSCWCFIANIEQISPIVLKFWLLNLIKKCLDGNVSKTKTNYVTSVYLSLRMVPNCKKNFPSFSLSSLSSFLCSSQNFWENCICRSSWATWYSSCFFCKAKTFSWHEAWSSSLLWALFLHF